MRKSQSTARIRQGARMDDTSPSEAVGLMGNLAVGDTASIHGAFPMKVGRNWGEGLKCGEMGRNWGETGAKVAKLAKMGRSAKVGRSSFLPTPVLRISAMT
jgi:hypothetical protein